MSFPACLKGEVFGHLTHIFKHEGLLAPYTIKTNEKTRLLVIEKEGVDKYVGPFLKQDFEMKYNFLRALDYFGDTRLNLVRMLPFIARSKMKRI